MIMQLLAASISPDQYDTNLPRTTAGSTQIQHTLTVVFGIIGGVAVLMIVIAGMRFITAQGNPQELSKAKNTIAYALVGLFIAIASEALVALTLGKFS